MAILNVFATVKRILYTYLSQFLFHGMRGYISWRRVFPQIQKLVGGGGTSVNRTGDVAGFLNIFNSTFCLLQLNNCKILEIVKHYAVLLRLASANCRKTPAMQLKNFAHWYYFKRL